MRSEPRAVLWDFDGTLVDTEPIWQEVQNAILIEAGVADLDSVQRTVGEHVSVTARIMAEVMGGDADPDELYDLIHERICERLRAGSLPWLPGAAELLAELNERRVPCALVTSSTAIVMEAVAAGLPSSFEFIINGDDVTNSKPHPEPYLMAMERLGVRPEEVVIIEDSPPGTASASATGAVVLAVSTESQIPPAPRRVLRQGLAGMTWAGLCSVWAKEWAK